MLFSANTKFHTLFVAIEEWPKRPFFILMQWIQTYMFAKVGTDIFANVIDDPAATFEIQADAAFPVADLFGNFDIVDATAGSTVSGNSRTEIDVTTGATTAGLPLKAIDISQDPENSDVATANTNVIVKINNHLFSAGTDGLA